ncbi:MAG: hypothetical protein ACRD1T_20505, partial [Acidimicrobiia bacterium]
GGLMAEPLDWRPLRPDVGEWAPVNPTSLGRDTYALIGDNSITDSHVRDISVTKLAGIGIKVYRSTAQTFATGSNDAVVFDTVLFNKGFPDPGASFDEVTVPYSGVYSINMSLEWVSNATGRRVTTLFVDDVSSERDTRNGTTGAATVSVLSVIKLLTAGQPVRMNGTQFSGGNLDIAGGENDAALSVIFQFAI